jgi:hypothetical protein
LHVSTGWRIDLLALLVLCVLAVALRCWLISHTQVAARDSIGFIRYAIDLERLPWTKVLREQSQMPLFPLLTLVTSVPVRAASGGMTCDAMVLSAQLANSFAGVLLVFPLYFLGQMYFGRWVGFATAAIFQCWPVCLHATTDGLSEGPFLLFVATAFWSAACGFRTPSAWRFGLVGLFTGAAYLTRPEGGEVAIATGLVIVGHGFRAWGWKAGTTRLAVIGAGLAIFVAPYVATTGNLSNKPTSRAIWDGELPNGYPSASCGHRPLAILSEWWVDAKSSGLPKPVWGAKAVANETAKTLLYSGVPFALIGLWAYRRRLLVEPGLWVPIVVACLHLLILLRMSLIVGYVSERHTLLVALAGCLWAASALPIIAMWVKQAGLPAKVSATGVATGLLTAQLVAGLPAGLKPPHLNRVGFRAAGEWLRNQVHSDDVVIDPFCWSHFYAGLVFAEGTSTPAPPERRWHYVVMDRSKSAHNRLPTMPLARDFASRGEIVFTWPTNKPPEEALVVVYRVPPPKP